MNQSLPRWYTLELLGTELNQLGPARLAAHTHERTRERARARARRGLCQRRARDGSWLMTFDDMHAALRCGMMPPD